MLQNFSHPLEKCVGHRLKNLGPSQKTFRSHWCPRLVTGLLIHLQYANKINIATPQITILILALSYTAELNVQLKLAETAVFSKSGKSIQHSLKNFQSHQDRRKQKHLASAQISGAIILLSTMNFIRCRLTDRLSLLSGTNHGYLAASYYHKFLIFFKTQHFFPKLEYQC